MIVATKIVTGQWI